MGYRALDVLLEKPTVKGNGLCKLFNSTISLAVKTATPGLIGHESHPRVASLPVHNLIAISDSV